MSPDPSPSLVSHRSDAPQYAFRRAEVTRVLFNLGGVAFEDFKFDQAEWPELKKKMPTGQVPVLEVRIAWWAAHACSGQPLWHPHINSNPARSSCQVDGNMLSQSAAIERFVAKLTGITPEDSFEAAKVDEACCFIQEIGDLLMATFSIKVWHNDLFLGTWPCPLIVNASMLLNCLGCNITRPVTNHALKPPHPP